MAKTYLHFSLSERIRYYIQTNLAFRLCIIT